ncbi:hypothetical protein [Alkalibacillus silvisoli]|uniref:Uncharacterized protein n=1 Tax=Alkalibacillus silvisoli TaxID=392823 RepID=A0ABP3K5K6_9BACI
MDSNLQAACIGQDLQSKGIPVFEGDLPYLQFMLDTIQYYSTPVKERRDWYRQVSILVFDQEVIRFD